MIKQLVAGAYQLDAWLHGNFGRAYVALLTGGLVVSIIGSVGGLRHAFAHGLGLGALAVILFHGGLLINQLAQWHELRERRRARGET